MITAYNRTKTRGSRCPYCVGQLPIKGETDLATLYPEIAAEEENKNFVVIVLKKQNGSIIKYTGLERY